MTEDLNNFFQLISENKKKKKEEFDSMVGDLGLDSLFNEFAGLKKKEKEKKSKKKEPSIGNINLDSVFEEVSNLKKETKKKKIKEEKTVKAFEKWLYSDSEKEEEVINEVIEESLDEVLEVIEENKEELEKTEEIEEKTFVGGSLEVPTEIGNNQSENIKELDKKFATLEDLDKHYKVFLSRIQQQLSSLGGGGEVRLEFLDDVDRNTAKVDGKYLKYQSSTGKWIGADASGGGSSSGIEVLNSGSSVGTGITSINFSTNVTATASGGIATITASGGGSSQTLDQTLQLGDTSTRGMSVGIVTATSFTGSGANLTNISNTSLDNTSVSFGGVSLDLGGTDATPAFNLSDSTAYPYTSLTGITTEIVGDTTPQLGGNLDINSKFITGTGGINVTGVITATTFDGNVTGNVTGGVSGNAGTATSLSSARNFSISGDVVAAAVSFDGTGDVVLSTAIQPNSVALATDTTGDFVQSITGTTNEVTVSATSGENSTPQIGLPNDVTIGQDLTVTRNIDVDGHTELDDVNVSGIITASSLNVTNKLITTGIGISIANGVGNTAYIEGPSEIWIDPHPFGVGQTSGSVRIKGDLYVDGTEFIVNVDKIQLGDFRIGIATTAGTNSLLDGAGLGIGSESIEKTITWNNSTSALMSSENWNLASGKHYEINGTDVLTSNTLGSGIINSSLTSVGTLGVLTVSGDVTANGNIVGDNATNISGINSVTATSFYGSGANLTSIPTTNLTGNITNGQLAGSIANNRLTNPRIIIGGVTLNLGDTDATPAFDLSDATAYPTSSLVGTITNAQLAGSIADGKLASTFLKNVVEDTTPQLGGNLDLNGKFITGTGGINVTGFVTATRFIGSLLGDAIGDVTGTASNASGATGDFSIADKIIHTGDTDTALRFPAADTFTVETAGSERLRVNSTQVDIGTSSSYGKISVHGSGLFSTPPNSTSGLADSYNFLRLEGSGANLSIQNTNNQQYAILQLDSSAYGQTTLSSYLWKNGIVNSQYGGALSTVLANYNGPLVFSTNTSANNTYAERMRIDTSGNVIVGGESISSTNAAYISQNGTYVSNRTTGTNDLWNGKLNGTVTSTINADGSIVTSGDLTINGGDIRVDNGSTSDGIIGLVWSTSYFGLKHADQTLNSEYMIMSADSHTFISATAGSSVYIRYGGNDSTNQLIVGSGSDALTWRGSKIFHAGNDGSGSGLDADTLDGLQLATGRNNVANQIVRTQGSGYAEFGWINTTSGQHTSTVTKVYSTYTTDGYIRHCTPNHLANSITSFGDVKLAAGKHLMRSDHHSGHLEGSYNSVGANSAKSNPIYTIGSSYNPTDAALSNMYGIGYSHTNASFISFTGASGWGMYVAADGDARVYLGGSNGNISCTGTLYQSASDGRLKTNVVPITDPIEKLKKIRGVTFDWVEDIASEYDFHPHSMHEHGVIAQEVQEVIPDAVDTAPFNGNYTKKNGTDHNFLTVQRDKIIPLLIESIKEQQTLIESLTARIESLENP